MKVFINKLHKKYPKHIRLLKRILFDRKTTIVKKLNALGPEFLDTVQDKLELISHNKVTIELLYSIVSKELNPKCKLKGCTNKCNFSSSNRQFNRYCSKTCYNASPENMQSIKDAMIKKHGVDNAFKSESVKVKIRKTNRCKYGVDNPSQSEAIKRKKRKTFRKNWGADHAMSTPEGKRIHQAACLEKYGVHNPMMIEDVQQKLKQVMLEKYGVDNIRKHLKAKRRIVESSIKTCLEKYGVPNAMQNPEILANWRRSVSSNKTIDVAGKQISVQGYEDLAITRIDQKFGINRITTEPKQVKTIPYKHLGKDKVYLADAKIVLDSGQRILLEVKSWFTLRYPSVVPKFTAAIKACKQMDCEFWLAIVEPSKDFVRILKNPDSSKLKALSKTAYMFSHDQRCIL